MKRAAFVRQPVDVSLPQAAELLNAVGDVAYIAGGAARMLVMGDEVPAAWDIDLFLYHPSDLARCLSALGELGYWHEANTERSAQFAPRDVDELAVQVIPFFRDAYSVTSGQPEDVLSCFSFTTEMFAIVKPGIAVVGASAVEDTRSRMLVVQNVTTPLVCGLRAVKHAYKGFGIAPEQLQIIFDAYRDRANAEAEKWRY